MPPVELHWQQAELNEEAAHSAREQFPDWAVTMCFYAVIHYVESHAIKARGKLDDLIGNRSNRHSQRREYVHNLAYRLREKDLIDAYEFVEDSSHKARYLTSIDKTAREHYANLGCDNVFEDLEYIRDLFKDLMHGT